MEQVQLCSWDVIKESSDIEVKEKETVDKAERFNFSKMIETSSIVDNTKPHQESTCIKMFDSKQNHNDMEMLKKLANQVKFYKKFDLNRLQKAAEFLSIGKFISFKNSEALECNNKAIEWRLYFKNILLSSVWTKSIKRGKKSVACSALRKFKNLSDYEIKDGRLMRRRHCIQESEMTFTSGFNPNYGSQETNDTSSCIPTGKNIKCVKTEFGNETLFSNSASSTARVIKEVDNIHKTFTHNSEFSNQSIDSHSLPRLSGYKIKSETVKSESDIKPFVLNSAFNSAVINNTHKPFTLNKDLFVSSMKDDFVLIVRRKNTQSFKNVLTDSAGFSKRTLNYDFERVAWDDTLQVKILMDNIIIGSALANGIEAAREKACQNAVDTLRKRYYIIRLKTEFGSGDIINRDDLASHKVKTEFGSGDIINHDDLAPHKLKTEYGSGDIINRDNLAPHRVSLISLKALTKNDKDYRMLNHNSGSKKIAEDSRFNGTPEQIGTNDQSSLGDSLTYYEVRRIEKEMKKEGKKLLEEKIKPILDDFSWSNSFGDLIFKNGFGRFERNRIGRIATLYGLSTEQKFLHGKRYTIVSRKYSPKEVLDYLANIGGSDSKYQLVDASTNEQKFF